MTITHTTPTTGAGTSAWPAYQAAVNRLRWEYTVTFRRHQRIHGTYTNNGDADQTACEHLRNLIPIVLAHHLPGIQLLEWDDQHTAVVDSTWRHGKAVIEVFWDYHPDWTIGDPTALTIRSVTPGRTLR